MPLGAWLVSVAWPAARSILVQLGIGFVSYSAVSAGVDEIISSANSVYSQGDSNILQFLAIAGIPTALGILAGAITARLAGQMSTKLRVTKS